MEAVVALAGTLKSLIFAIPLCCNLALIVQREVISILILKMEDKILGITFACCSKCSHSAEFPQQTGSYAG